MFLLLGFNCNKINEVHIYILAKLSTVFDLCLHEVTSPGRELEKPKLRFFRKCKTW